MRAVFIDIDDTLLTDRSYVLPGNIGELARGIIAEARPERVQFDPVGIAYLNRLAELADDLRFVLSTTWRHAVGVPQTMAALERNGLRGDRWHAVPSCPWREPTEEERALGSTSGSSKADDMLAWLQAHAEAVTRWVAFDDDSDIQDRLRWPPVPGAVVLVNPTVGIQPYNFGQALAALDMPDDPVLGRHSNFRRSAR